MNDKKTFIDYKKHRITKSFMRVGTKQETVYKLWWRNGDVWTPDPQIFATAEDAKKAIGEI